MTQKNGVGQGRNLRWMGPRKRLPSPISLRQTAPTDWHHDRPAFAGDPLMDWESTPEPPPEPRWTLTEARSPSGR